MIPGLFIHKDRKEGYGGWREAGRRTVRACGNDAL